jgi:ectoine hydroxylase-related dioxygenase (phytanoyl-CoA dioxygenase family)
MHGNSVSFYKKNGYYIAKDIFSEQLPNITMILFEIDTIIVQQLRRLSKHLSLEISGSKDIVHEHLSKLLLLDKAAYIASLKLCANLFSIMALLMNKNVLNLMHTLGIQLPVLQSQPVLHIMAEDLKIPGGYHGIGVHQDWASLQGSLDTIIVWIPFMNVNSTNFPLEFIPGSHLGGLYPGKISEYLYEIDPHYYDEQAFVSAELSLGDALFMSSFLLHKTGMKNSHGLRIACTIRYENAAESTYVNRIYPHAQKRTVNREFIHPDFPSAEEVGKIFL